MALMIDQGSSAASGNIVKIDCKSRMVKYRTEGEDGEIEVEPATFAGIIDLPNIEIGYVRFSPFDKRTAPHKLISTGKVRPVTKPDDTRDDKGRPVWRGGFSVNVKLPKSMGGGVHDMTSSTMLLGQAVDALHDLFLAAPESAQGKLPVVRISNWEPIKTKNQDGGTNTNYKPIFAISSWVDRPGDMPETEGKALVAATAADDFDTAASPAPATKPEFDDDEIPF